MIEKTQSFKTSDGELFTSVEAAQLHELEKFLEQQTTHSSEPKVVAQLLLTNKEKIVDLLTMKATSHPKARKVNGASRKSRTAAVPLPGVTATK